MLTQDREDIIVKVRRDEGDGKCVVAIDFLDTVADCALTVRLTEKTAHELGENLVYFMHDKHITVGNDEHYVAVDE